MSQIDVLCVGDTVTDVFIKIPDNQAERYDNERGKWLAIPFGAKLPYEFADVQPAHGNAANAAVSMSRLGLAVAYETYVGGDQVGHNTIMTLGREEVDTRFIHIQPKKTSNTNYILWCGDERTILVKHEAFKYNWPHFRKVEMPRWIYFSSLSEHSLDYHDEIAEWLEEHSDIKLAFCPGTFQMKLGAERLKRIYAQTDIVLLNREEAVQVTGGNYDDLHDLLNKLHGLGCKMAVVTDGPSGAYASDGQGGRWSMPLYPDPTPPVERTGAGDAYASTLIASLAKGYDLVGALQRAPINSMNVVQHVGPQAGLLTEHKLEQWLKQAPDWYHVSPLT